jgi:hypothetical protein
MSTKALLGLYETPDAAADAVENLQRASIESNDYEILSGTPYPEGTFGEPPVQHKLYVFPLVGAAIGITLALFEGFGTQLAFPMVTGGKPILSVPPMIILCYELTLLGAILFTVLGIIFESRLPIVTRGLYDERITEGLIGVVCTFDEDRDEEITKCLNDAGALEIKSEE